MLVLSCGVTKVGCEDELPVWFVDLCAELWLMPLLGGTLTEELAEELAEEGSHTHRGKMHTCALSWGWLALRQHVAKALCFADGLSSGWLLQGQGQ